MVCFFNVPSHTGYVDDPRNTDNAWMETVALHFHCSRELGNSITLEARESGSVQWLTVADDNPAYQQLYADHKMFVDTAVTNFLQHRKVYVLSFGSSKSRLTLFLPSSDPLLTLF
jgi:ADP-ribose pyrophosphatase